jgi:hypothetical protein
VLSRLEHLTVNQGVACSSQARGAFCGEEFSSPFFCVLYVTKL